MSKAQELADAVRNGELSFETALEEALDNHDDPLDDVLRILGFYNLGDRNRSVDLGGVTVNVEEFVARYNLTPFVALLNDQEGFHLGIGEVVSYGGGAYRILGRRAVSPFATPRYDDWELLIESLDSGTVGFVGEGEVDPVEGDDADKE
jgi:hypothetical protein